MPFTENLALYAQEYQRIGEKIGYHRRLIGLTQKELGRRVGISASYIAKIESAQCISGLSLDLFFTLCHGINTDPITILTKEPEDQIRIDIKNRLYQGRKQLAHYISQ